MPAARFFRPVLGSACVRAQWGFHPHDPREYFSQDERALAGDFGSEAVTLQFFGDQDIDGLGRGDQGVAHKRGVDLHLDEVFHHLALAALDVLDGTDAGEFAPLYDDVRGDALETLGDKAGARDAYQRALDSAAPGVDRAFVRMKLEALGLNDESS